jgi:hypothetical protein
LEDRDILEFNVKNKRLSDLKGNTPWDLIMERGIAGGRSAQSMKERFRKRLAKNVHHYHDVVPKSF